ncbi:phosphatase PAP2 family protein [Neptunitalea sp. Y10]|uniref:Phosphatase PAP2 family protein n=2 Tax=Neptunitalea lumnitzerae TaxID=2965509 RepID=A0ABQ5MKW0_9FLAO|nr:phosphatase PAP2 family protein [Neptunitalea sp. Y10]
MIIKRYTKQEALRILYTFLSLLAVTLSLTYYVKVYVLRSRPVNNKEIFESLRIMIQPIDYSFFSGHACNSFAITTFFYLFMRRKMKNAWVFYLWPILFSYSRLYFAVHFPSDVLVGALVGIATAITSYNLYKKFSPKITRDDLEVESDS